MKRTVAPLASAAVFLAVCPELPAAVFPTGGDYAVEESALDAGGGVETRGGDFAVKGELSQVQLAGISRLAGGGYVDRGGFYDPPHLTYEGARDAGITAAGLTLSLPAGSVPKRRYDVTLNRDPAGEPMMTPPGAVADANMKIEHNGGGWASVFPSHLREFAVFDEEGFHRAPLSPPGTLTIAYSDEDGDGVIDGSCPPVRADTLAAWTLDEEGRMWMAMSSSALDKVSRTLRMPLAAPGAYALIGQLDTAVNNVFAYPVPFRPNGPRAGSGVGQTGTEADGITFASVPQQGNIEIYTLDGRLVRRLPIPGDLVVPKLKWDVRTASGEKAASGAYVWRVGSGSNSRTGKLMVIW